MKTDKSNESLPSDGGATAVESKTEPKAAPPVTAPAAVKKTIEEWGLAKKMLPQFFDPPAPPVISPELMRLPAVGISMGALAPPKHNAKHVEFVAAKALRGWPVGMEVTEDEFDTAVVEAMNQSAR